ncbi:hypothetical protein [Amycolatopsis regifaucium]|uniref:hypothetical protein n=1 Tax=Amycolatopsis regifaucium TaxID=546365 RepID=UPI0008F638D5|nr:hypothetical protein [Amycolatopsis regifaucium]SFH33196.1 hypothetical protein SAMN04489731_103558 [Amycolatopsis regifaucium]
MNNTPAWLTIAVAGSTALVAILTASITTWLNVKSANKRSKEELASQRRQFAEELEHQRAQERFKLLFDRKVELYTNTLGAIRELSDVYVRIEAAYDTALEHGEFPVSLQERAVADNERLKGIGSTLSDLAIESFITSSIDVSLVIQRIGHDVGTIASLVRKHHEAGTWAQLDVRKIRDFLMRNHGVCIQLMASDVGADGSGPKENIPEPTPEELAGLLRPPNVEN